MTAYQSIQKVLFNHCDPAGIVFYPRYFEMLNGVVEEWFEEALNCSFAEMHLNRKTGVPTAHLEVDFKKPSRLGEELIFEIGVEKLGGSSADCVFAVTGRADHVLRFEGKLTLVYFSMETGRALRWPADLSQALKTFIISSKEQENNNA
ncbi:acyl-CoA thioesterase [Aestuariispira insulae]|uniref:4-hydroxybenzoyl-CoA thioesterase n=1 Tax=Aestuariispira insulae TaxID=1461337 RepID=A0A3D9HHQ0_9PROT|nr:thioesterase family protein [Aestuariispira insulae]RED49062.1 4-hydroxybenzoyl-CoA thioesterase [Aestuariispira insulae]